MCLISIMLLLNVFSTDHLVLKTNWCALPERTVSPLSVPELPAALSMGLRPHALFLVYFGLSIGTILGQLMGVTSDVTRRHNLTGDFLILWVLQSLESLLINVPEP